MPEVRLNFTVFYGDDLAPLERIARGGRDVSRFGKEGAWRRVASGAGGAVREELKRGDLKCK